MLTLQDDGAPYRIIGIDPGTNTLGLAEIDVDLLTGHLSVGEVKTLVGAEDLKYFGRKRQIHGDRFVRLGLLEEAIVEHLKAKEPTVVICESPFFNPRRPGAYYALVEAMSMVQRAVYRYNDNMSLMTIDPASAKANLGVSGKSGDKDAITPALAKAVWLQDSPAMAQLPTWDEHSRDALVIAYYQACQVRSQLAL
jgi:Holliday junction resolvasome RuvABC endonuclease subunit